MRVGQERQVGDPVADLLLRPVAAAADHVGAQALLLERLLVEAQRARRADEDDDVALRAARVDLGAEPVRDRARLGAAPGLRRERREPELLGALVPARGLDREQLDGGRPGRIGLEQPQLLGRPAGDERREALAQQRPDRRVDDRQDLLARPEVDGEAADTLAVQRVAPGTEDPHVGMAEAVDRLRLVADGEEVAALERLEHVELQPVRVLELVDHDEGEALRPALALRGVGEEVADPQLEVVEVDRGAGGLRGGVGAAERVEQPVEQRERGPGVVGGAGLAVGGPRLAVGGARGRLERLRARAELRRVERAGQRRLARASAGRRRPSAGLGAPRPRPARGGREPLGGLQRLARLRHAQARPGRRQRGGGRRGRRGERSRVRQRRGRRDRQPRMRLTAAAQRGVRVEDHRLELASVGRREVDRLRPPRRRPGLERGLERLRRQPLRGGLVEHAEARVEPRRERAAAQHAGAEAVDRPDPGGVGLACTLRLAQLVEAPADPVAELGRRLLREGQRQDRADRDAVAQHRLGEALDHHRRLAGARPGCEQRRPLAVGDRRALLGREPHAGGSLRGSPARQMAG